MTYLDDYVTARAKIREYIPKLIAGIMPILDRADCTYEALREGQPSYLESADSLIVSLPDGSLPEGYQLRIDFVPVKAAEWIRPDSDKKGARF